MSTTDPPLELTEHARTVLAERGIDVDWVSRVLTQPARTEVDRLDPSLRHALGPITERDGRVLRVVYNSNVNPMRRDRVLRPAREEAPMKVHYDEKADAIYFRLDDAPIAESEEVQPGIILDYNDRDQVIGIEILDVKARVPLANLRQMQFEVA